MKAHTKHFESSQRSKCVETSIHHSMKDTAAEFPAPKRNFELYPLTEPQKAVVSYSTFHDSMVKICI